MTIPLAGGRRRDITLGRFGSPESKQEYRRQCALLAGNGGIYPDGGDGLTVAEAVLKYLDHVKTSYGPESSYFQHTRHTLAVLNRLYAHDPVAEIGPKALRQCQDEWVRGGIVRKSINKMTGTMKRMWRWMVAEELVHPVCRDRLEAVEGLRLGRTAAKESPPVQPANRADVEAILPHVPPAIAAVIQLQMLTGARCGELLAMKPADVDRSGKVWIYSPVVHKGTWRGKSRSIFLGPAAQAVLAPFLIRAGDGYVFSPARSEDERNALRSEGRATPRWESHMRRNAIKRPQTRKRPPGDRYDTLTVDRAIARACDRHGVPRFTPHQLRHLAAHTIRAEVGIDYARAVLGHTVASMTERYSRETDHKLAATVAEKMG
jgi:integrase